VVICLERGADLHTAQLMPLPLNVSCFSKIQIGFTFLVSTHPGSPGKKAVKRVCIVCLSIRQHRSVVTLQNTTAHRRTNLSACSDIVFDEIEVVHECFGFPRNRPLEVRKKAQRGKEMKGDGEAGAQVVEVGDELLESGIGVVQAIAEQHAHDDVGHTRRDQRSDVERTTALLSDFVYHLVNLGQDPRLHHSTTEAEPLHDRQTQLMLVSERSVVVAHCNSCRKTTRYSITHSLLLSRLKTFLLCKSFPLQPFLSST